MPPPAPLTSSGVLFSLGVLRYIHMVGKILYILRFHAWEDIPRRPTQRCARLHCFAYRLNPRLPWWKRRN